MLKLSEYSFGYIDLYGNDVYGLRLVLDQIRNREGKEKLKYNSKNII
jgi:hypothetical protein